MPDPVTLRFESTIESENSDPILLSGPIQIFATVDYINELESQEIAATINNTSREEISQIIIFVAHVEDHENSQSHRGAYFLLDNEERSKEKEQYAFVTDWCEILLGTHSHDNMSALESIGETSATKGVVVSNGDGTFTTKSIQDFLGNTGSYLPAFPKEIQDRLDELRNLGLQEPSESEWNHLDADLSELTDPYDWLSPDHINIAVGNCRDLYRALVKADKKLYLSSDYSLSTSPDSRIGWLQLAAYSVDYNYGARYDNGETVVASKDNASTNKLLLSLDLPWNVLPNDILYFFDEKELIESYKIISAKDRKLILRLPTSKFSGRDKPSALTVMAIRDCLEDERELEYDIKDAIEAGTLSLDDINVKLAQLYMEGELYRKPNLPKLYLATDEYGTIHWENKLLPQQYFYSRTVVVDQGYITENLQENGKLRFIFKDAYYRTDDFPLLVIDGMFAMDNTRYSKVEGRDLIYELPMSDKIYDFDLNSVKTHVYVSLILIKNSLSGSLADEIADKYISKTDAIAILSNGRIKLDDYATLNELLKYSKIGHTHSQYALKDHNHDYRYANFYHTHHDLFRAVAQLISTYVSGQDVNVITSKLEQLSLDEQGKYERYINSLLANAGFESNPVTGEISFRDRSVLLSSDVVEAIDHIIEENSASVPKLSLLLKPTVKDAIETLALLFLEDTVTDSQVVLDNTLPVRLLNGPVGGLSTNKIYEKGTSLQTILRDILNPHITIEEMREMLTPVAEYSKIHWYVIEGEEYIEISADNIRYDHYQNNPLYFTCELRNKFDELCEYTIYKSGIPFVLKPDSIEITIGEDTVPVLVDGKYQYCSSSLEADFNKVYPSITIEWDTRTKITDNYGIGRDDDYLEGNGIMVLPVDFIVNVPDFYVGQALNVDNLTAQYIMDHFQHGDEKSKISVPVDAGRYLTIVVLGEYDHNFTIYDNSIDMTDYFDVNRTIMMSDDPYIIYTYKTLVTQDFDIVVVTKKD